MRTVFLSPGFPAVFDIEEQFRVYHNTPDVGYIMWQNLHIVYRGATYLIPDGYTDKKFVWWDYDYPYQLQATDTFPENMTEDDLLVFLNKNGTAVVVPKSTIVPGDLIVPGSILADHLSANCVTSEKILAGEINSNHIAANAIGAQHIAAGAIMSEHIAAGSVTADKVNVNQLSAISGDLGTITAGTITGGTINADVVIAGQYAITNMDMLSRIPGLYYATNTELLGSQVAELTRVSVAYKQDGTQVATNILRYEYTSLPYPLWQDTFDTDQLSQYTSGGDTPATWAVSGGVLTGTGGTQATLIKNDLLLQDCEIVVNCDQAQNGRVIARYQDNNNYYRLRLSDDSGSFPTANVTIQKRVAGALTDLASADITWTRGTSKQIKFVCKGQTLEAWVDGVKVLSVTDSSFSGGMVGLGSQDGTNRFLDFTVYYAQQGVMAEEGTTNLYAQSNLSTFHGYPSNTAAVQQADGFWKLSFGTDTEWLCNSQITITNGQTYTESFYFYCDGTPGTFNITFYTANGHHAVPATIVPVGYSPVIGKFLYRAYATYTTVAGDNFIRCIDINNKSGGTWTYIAVGWAQLEQKAYLTSYAGDAATRSAEALTVPTAGVFNKGNWTVKLRFTPTSKQDIAGRYAWLWNCFIDSNNYYAVIIHETGRVYTEVRSGGTYYNTYSASAPVLSIGQTYFITASGDGSKLRLFVNGTQIGGDVSYVEPVGTLPTSMYVGGIPQPNGIVSDFAVLNKAQTLAEHQAEHWTGRPLVVDENTTYLMSCNGTLRQTSRKRLLQEQGTFVVADASTTKNPTKATYIIPVGSQNADAMINQAIMELPNTGGKIVLLDGVFNISNSIVLPNNVAIEGQGSSSVIKTVSDVSGIMNSNSTSGNTNIRINNLKIDCNNRTGKYGIYFNKVSNSTISNTCVTACNYDGIGAFNCDSISVYNCISEGNSYDGIHLENITNCTINGSMFKNNEYRGIHFKGNSNKNTISANVVVGNQIDGICVEGFYNTITGNTVTGNTFIACGIFVGLGLNGTNIGGYTAVTSNVVKDNAGAGIFLHDASHCNISSNIIENNCLSDFSLGYGSGISISASSPYYSDYNNIQNNTVRRGTNTYQLYGIRIVDSSCRYNVITNNDLVSSGSVASLSDSGIGTVTAAGNRL